MKDNYIKSIYEHLGGSSDEDERDDMSFTDNDEPSDENNSLVADQDIEIEVEYLDGRDARVVCLKQGLNKVTIPEDKVDHYMSEIMGMLDAGFKPNTDASSNWEDELPKFN